MGLLNINKEFKFYALKSLVKWRKIPSSLLFYFEIIIFKINKKFRKSTFKKYPKRAHKLAEYINSAFAE